MQSVNNLITKIRAFDINLIYVNVFSLQVVQDFVIDLNTQKQLFDENVGSENVLLPMYSPVTMSLKPEGYPDRFTLNDTGDFYDSFKLEIGRNYFLIIADGDKEDENILDKYSDFEVLGLTEDSKDLLVDFIKPFIRKEIKNALQ